MINFKLTQKTKDILKGLLYVAGVCLLIYTITNIVREESEDSAKLIIQQAESQALKAQEERQKIRMDAAIMNEELIHIKKEAQESNFMLKGFKSDFNNFYNNHQKLIHNEKAYIPNATISEQLDFISTVKYQEYK